MAILLGTAPQFDGNTADWEVYTEQLSHFFTANKISSEDQKRSVLVTVCGSATYKLMRSLAAPTDVASLKYADLVKLVQDHYNPAPSVIVMRFKFNSCVSLSGESISAYVARLRDLAQYCVYGATLDDMLRDRLVCGIQDERLQRRLLAEKDLTFQKAFEIAQLYESAEANAKALSARTAQLQVAYTPVDRGPPLDRGPPGTKDQRAESACYRCGGRHIAATCRFRDTVCNYCRKRGHIARVCRSRQDRPNLTRGTPPPSQPRRWQQRSQGRALCLAQDTTEEEGITDTSLSQDLMVDYTMFQVATDRVDRVAPFTTSVVVAGTTLSMEVDTGAAVTLISKNTYEKSWPQDEAPQLQDAHLNLRTYTGEKLPILGSASVTVEYKGQREELRLLVVEGSGPSLLGRDWLGKLRLDWSELHSIRSQHSALDNVLAKHQALFKDELGTVRGTTAKIHVAPEVHPRFHKARSVPYALRGKVEQALERLEKDGVIEPVEFSEWAAPIVPVIKKDGSIRLCGDYKTTVNQAARVDSYPIPRIEDLFASLAGGKAFSKLDLAHAYQQVVLDETSKMYVTINTHKGLYRYNRLPFGVSSAPAIFQRTMESILGGLPQVCVYLDDILITGDSEAAHLRNLEAVLSRLETAGIRLKREKCEFMLPQVEYLGHRISASGLQPTLEKVRAITAAPTPADVSQLKSYLGLLNYYSKFLPNLATELAPLYELLQKHKRWNWGKEQQEAFQSSKSRLTVSLLLVHYDPHRELLLSCDASPYGVGAVLSHKMEDGTEQPIAFASRSLSQAERKYSQLDKEALAIVFGVKRFH